MSKVIMMKKVWIILVSPRPHGGCHCTSQTVQVCMVSLQGQGILKSRSIFIIICGGKDFPVIVISHV